MNNSVNLKEFAIEIRKETIKSIGNLGVGHIGGSLSIVDLLAVLYGKEMNIDPHAGSIQRTLRTCCVRNAGFKRIFPKRDAVES